MCISSKSNELILIARPGFGQIWVILSLFEPIFGHPGFFHFLSKMALVLLPKYQKNLMCQLLGNTDLGQICIILGSSRLFLKKKGCLHWWWYFDLPKLKKIKKSRFLSKQSKNQHPVLTLNYQKHLTPLSATECNFWKNLKTFTEKEKCVDFEIKIFLKYRKHMYNCENNSTDSNC